MEEIALYMSSQFKAYRWYHNLSRSYHPVNNITEPLVGCYHSVRPPASWWWDSEQDQRISWPQASGSSSVVRLALLVRHNIVRDIVMVIKVFSMRTGSVCKRQVSIQNAHLFQVFAHSMMENIQCNQSPIRWLTLMLILAPAVGNLRTHWWWYLDLH